MIQWDTKKVLMVGAVVVALTQIGKFLEGASWLIGSPATAYAAKATAEEVDEKFALYLERQSAYTESMNRYVEQQQRANQQQPYQRPEVWIEEDEDGHWWCSDGEHTWRWTEREGCGE